MCLIRLPGMNVAAQPAYFARSSITATKSCHTFWTELICTFSSGEWAPWMFGPKLTMSRPG